MDSTDALCEIRREVIFFDIQSDGDVFWERVLLALFFGLMLLSLLDHFHGAKHTSVCSLLRSLLVTDRSAAHAQGGGFCEGRRRQGIPGGRRATRS